MQIVELKNKDGQVMTTKDGKVLTKNLFEVGDEFIPVLNKIYEQKNEVKVFNEKTQKEEDKVITNYSILAKVKDAMGGFHKPEDESKGDGIFVELTPTQAKAIQKKLTDGVEINQHLFNAYAYKNDFGDQIGVGIKVDFKPAKSFEDFN